MNSQTTFKSNRLILYAPGIHTGGGLTLLKALLESKHLKYNQATLFLDTRSLADIYIPDTTKLYKIQPTLIARLKAEKQLATICRHDDTVICLHSLPPIFRLRGHTVCFLQNSIHLGQFPLRKYPLRIRIRLLIESKIASIFKSKVDTYFVQTLSMKRALLSWYKGQPHIVICPFASLIPNINEPAPESYQRDLVYIADGSAHKNHLNLIKAWVILAEKGIHPSLTLTLTERDDALHSYIESMQKEHGLRIENRCKVPQNEIFTLYTAARALIFPSYTESLGLPLIEAAHIGLPIVASELDYVRDVCSPVETFDPSSPLSIARAVERFLSIENETTELYSADAFIHTALMRDASEPLEPPS